MLRALQMRDFRCWQRLDLEPLPGLNFITGPNAAGKTSILEAACCLLRLQSPRTSSLGDVIRRTAAAARVSASTDRDHLEFLYSAAGRKIRLNGKGQPGAGDYLAVGRVGWMGNEDLQLVKGPAAARRRYLDFLGSQLQPAYLTHLRRYDRALRSRNFLFRKEERPSPKQLAAYAALLIEHGEPLLEERRRLVGLLSPLAQAAAGELGEHRQEIALRYAPGATAPLAEALEGSAEEERRRRTTVVGPHRDDLALLLDGEPAAVFASEGQQRTLVLALKLAQFRLLKDETGRTPVLLIDDVFGELDPDRRNALLAALPPDSQSFITTTFLDWASLPDGIARFAIEEGLLVRKD